MKTPKHYNQILDSLTMSEVIKWIHNYDGDNSFLCSCQKLMLSNRPLSQKQIIGLRKSCAYYLTAQPRANTPEQKQKLEQEIAELVNS